jgi:hypothetical protein
MPAGITTGCNRHAARRIGAVYRADDGSRKHSVIQDLSKGLFTSEHGAYHFYVSVPYGWHQAHRKGLQVRRRAQTREICNVQYRREWGVKDENPGPCALSPEDTQWNDSRIFPIEEPSLCVVCGAPSKPCESSDTFTARPCRLGRLSFRLGEYESKLNFLTTSG